MKRIAALGMLLCIVLFSTVYAEELSCVNMTNYVPNTVPDLICSTYSVDVDSAMNVLMKSPYLIEDTESYYMGTGWLNDEEELAIGPDYLFYSTHQGRNLANVVSVGIPGFLEWNYTDSSELSFGDISQIEVTAQEILKKLNIQAELIHVQAYSKPMLNVEMETAIGNIETDQIEECYVLFFCCTENGIRVSTDGYYSDLHSVGLDGSHITMIWTKDGLQFMSAEGLFRIEAQLDNETSIILPASALNMVRDYYVLYDVDISHQRLEYVRVPIQGVDLDKGYTLVPAWVFSQVRQYEITGDAGENEIVHVITDFALIDARTGEEL